MKNKKTIILMMVGSLIYLLSSCMKEMHNEDMVFVEDSVALAGMNVAYSGMLLYNDSMDNDHTNIHAKQWHDHMYHYHDSLYLHHHTVYHHGDTLHHHDMHHTQNNHHLHDSLNNIHHKNHH